MPRSMFLCMPGHLLGQTAGSLEQIPVPQFCDCLTITIATGKTTNYQDGSGADDSDYVFCLTICKSQTFLLLCASQGKATSNKST